MGDVLAVQEQLDTMQSQIEQLQGQLQLLTSQTSYSTLTVTVSERTPAAPHRARCPESGLVRAWHASIGGFVAGVEGVIRMAGPAALRPAAAGRRPGRRPRPVAALPAPQPVGSAQAPMAAASGMPGMETTPTPRGGPTSSLTAIGPEAARQSG